jgi:hypothetical protein
MQRERHKVKQSAGLPSKLGSLPQFQLENDIASYEFLIAPYDFHIAFSKKELWDAL